jgi:hypothetical protein
MGVIRPLVYLTIGFVIGNIYHGCTAEPRVQASREQAGIERLLEERATYTTKDLGYRLK